MKKYETFEKIDKKYVFIGWYPMPSDNNCIETKTKKQKVKEYNTETRTWDDSIKTWIYKTYEFNDGKTSLTKTYKYGAFVKEDE